MPASLSTPSTPLADEEGTDVKSHPGSRRRDLLRGLRILVVDDEEDARELLSILLTSEGARVETAGSASEALEALMTFHPHLLLSDIGMPGQDGYTLLRQIRTMPSEQRNIPAVAVTAYVRRQDVEKALAAGFQRHLPKPIDARALVDAILSLRQ